MDEIRFDDIEGLNAAASDEFGDWGKEVEVSQEIINGFADLTGDLDRIGAEGLRFLAPVPAGSKVHARGRVVRAEEKPKGTLITTEAEIAVVGAEKPAILYKMQVLYR